MSETTLPAGHYWDPQIEGAVRKPDGTGPYLLADILDPETSGNGSKPSEPRRLIDMLSVGQLAERVEAAGAPSWLIEGLWPADAYGVIGAEDKAGKTWAAVDLAVSVATGSAWLDLFPCPTPGGVFLYLGEGGERPSLRRLEAITRSRGGTLKDLDLLRVGLGVPRLASLDHLTEMQAEVESTAPRLVIVDPLYLAAAGAKGSDLYGMGEVLGGVQRLCQAAGAALVVVTHWNKGGIGKGPERFTGVGPGAWGRVLASAAVERRAMEPDGASVVHLLWDFRGSEIGDRAFRMRRRVRAEDPSDLASPLVYQVEVTEEDATAVVVDGLSPSQRRVMAALEQLEPMAGVQQIGDVVAADAKGRPLRKRTIQDALAELEKVGMAEGTPPLRGSDRLWSRRTA